MDILLRLCLWDVYDVSIGMWCFVAACFAHNGGVLNVAYSEELQDNWQSSARIGASNRKVYMCVGQNAEWCIIYTRLCKAANT